MFLLGHIGITVGIVYLLAWFISSHLEEDNPGKLFPRDIDFRLVIIAAILPDIIDKVVGMIILKDQVSNGRIFTHTLMIVAILSICLFTLARVKFRQYQIIFYYVLPLWLHLSLDRLWEDPHTLFWPIFGTGFRRLDIAFSDYFTILLSDPYVFIGEIMGTLIMVTLLIKYRLFIRMRLYDFLKNGKLMGPPDSQGKKA